VKGKALHRVLLVDDNADVRALVARQLKHLGYQVDATADASEFLGKLASVERKYDLAVVDIRLPGLTGDKIISWLRNSELDHVKNLPVLVITGYVRDVPKDVLEDSLRLQVLEKPFTIRDLESSVRNITLWSLFH